MIFTETKIPGAFIIDPEPISDERGFFARVFCAETFARQGLDPVVSQASISYNARRGTLRGLHLQIPPHGEPKIVHCYAGAIFDVIVDARPRSRTRGQWFGIELSAKNRRRLYIPDGVAHGFQVLVDDTEVHYQMSVPYGPDAARGIKWDDPALAIDWPLRELVFCSPADQAWPDFAAAVARLP